jgi:hypothetical protein
MAQPAEPTERASPPLASSGVDSVAEAPAAARPPPPPPRSEPTAQQTRAEGEATPTLAIDASPKRGAHVHDGFYLRLAIGANYGRAFVQTNRRSEPEVRIIGMGRSFDVWAGRTVPPGFVIGFNMSAADVSTDAADLGDGRSAEGNALMLSLGGFLDAYPDPQQGYHFGGSLGLAALAAGGDAAIASFLGAGFSFSMFAGYDAWVAPQLSIGGLLRLGGAVARNSPAGNEDEIVRQGTTYGAQLLATVVYH